MRDIDLLVVGDLNPDLVLRGDVVPRFGQSEQLLDGADLTLGGSAAIMAHGAARLGLRTALVAVVGADAFGELSLGLLKQGGVDVSGVTTHLTLPTGLTVILVHDGSRTSLTLPGAVASLDPARVGVSLLRQARHVHAASFYLQPALAAGLPALFERARAAGATTSLDTNFDPAGQWDGLGDVLPVTDVLLPNRAEALAIAARLGPDPGTDLEAAAQNLATRGPLVVVKDGENGALAAVPRHPSPAGSPAAGAAVPGGVGDGGVVVVREEGVVVEAVDTTGAGDTFDAAFLFAHLAGRPVEEALALACRAAAASTRAIGGTTAQPTLADLRPTTPWL